METTIQRTDVLLVVDLQNDFCPGGALAVQEGDAIVPLVNALQQRFSHVILTQDWHPEGHISFASSHPGKQPFEVVEVPYGHQRLWPDHCVQGSPGAAFHPELNLDRAELVVRKGYAPAIDSYSAFLDNDKRTPTGLMGALRERRLGRLFLCGLAYDYCVHYSALDGARLGFECFVIEDACRAIDVEGSVARANAEMAAAGVHRLLSTELVG